MDSHGEEGVPFQADRLTRLTLGNGFTVLVQRDSNLPVVASTIWYKVGSSYESYGSRGLSHLLEHLMFKGTVRFKKGEIDQITTRNGGVNNAFTSLDYTAFYFCFSAEKWWIALEIEASRMLDNLFEANEFELERRVVLEELRMEMDHPWGALRKAVDGAAFSTGHPYRHQVIGSPEDLIRLDLPDIRRFYRHHYRPDRAVLVVVGDIEESAVLERVQKLFGHLEPCLPEVPKRPAFEVSDFPGRPARVRTKTDSEITRLLFSFPAPPLTDSSHIVFQLLDKILVEGKLSRLHRVLIEETEVASSIASELSETADCYLFFLRVELQVGVSPGVVEELVLEQLKALSSEAVGMKELARAQNQCLMDYWSDQQSVLDRALQIGLYQTLGALPHWNQYVQRLSAISPEDVIRVARRFLAWESATVGVSSRPSGDR